MLVRKEIYKEECSISIKFFTFIILVLAYVQVYLKVAHYKQEEMIL